MLLYPDTIIYCSSIDELIKAQLVLQHYNYRNDVHKDKIHENFIQIYSIYIDFHNIYRFMNNQHIDLSACKLSKDFYSFNDLLKMDR